MEAVHSGFDALKFTIKTRKMSETKELIQVAKTKAMKTNTEIFIEVDHIALSVRSSGAWRIRT